MACNPIKLIIRRTWWRPTWNPFLISGQLGCDLSATEELVFCEQAVDHTHQFQRLCVHAHRDRLIFSSLHCLVKLMSVQSRLIIALRSDGLILVNSL
jgi:hypothetical protein